MYKTESKDKIYQAKLLKPNTGPNPLIKHTKLNTPNNFEQTKSGEN